ncbi:UDP-2,3-diacylglucosamine hydrolase [Porphyromonas macacae]|uniref:UDP-2,3-diacylglucosamine diphosphatase n=1 Tax=Porphyromonas macacae TaxID=28115 RepID=UPI00052D5D6C|nr:UDP-2,3-diacylglucosamine diphosphatase [Porphyromonas macacae]KGN97678.1 UDP-2,3-diacylglucosamine hydrolase [Porphyromonas macacae]
MPARTRIYFTSDAHLGSAFHEDPRGVERCLCRWLEHIKQDAIALYLLGDMFDYWYEYHSVVPRGFTRFLGKLAELNDAGVEIHFFTGNHDIWIRDYLQKEVGAIVHRNACEVKLLGKTFRLSHGDEEYRTESFSYNLIYKAFRNPVLKTLFSAIHPRWTVGFAHSWSLHSRKQGLKRQTEGRIPHAYKNEYFEVEKEPLVLYAKRYSEQHPEVDFFIFGHRHLFLDLAMRSDKRVIILGDWIRYNSYAVWDGQNLLLDQWEPRAF